MRERRKQRVVVGEQKIRKSRTRLREQRHTVEDLLIMRQKDLQEEEGPLFNLKMFRVLVP